MKTVDRDFLPLVLGNDINAYSMARAFYEAYQVKTWVMGKYSTGPSCHSKIIEYQAHPMLDQQEVLVPMINDLASRWPEKKIILLGCGDNYVEQIIKNRGLFCDNVVAPYVGEDLMQALITKESFYQMCDHHGLDYPATVIYNQGMGEDYHLPFGFPVILKPSNTIQYWENEFAGQKKVYMIQDRDQLVQVIRQIYQAGYKHNLIIQDYIPGEDTVIWTMNCFSGRDKKVRLMSLGHVMLEEYTPHGLGNAAVVINDYNQELSIRIRDFLDSIGMEGFCNFDIKYDYRDGKFKLFEINLRQGRSSYYVTGAGFNLAKYVTEEYIYQKPLGFEIVQAEHLWTAVPMWVAYRVVKDPAAVKQMKQLVRNKQAVNPLFFKVDKDPRRLLHICRSHLSHFLKYRAYY